MSESRNANFTIPILVACFLAATISTFCLFQNTPVVKNIIGTTVEEEPEPEPILVPVADWTSPISDITSEELAALKTAAETDTNATTETPPETSADNAASETPTSSKTTDPNPDVILINFDDLTPDKKLLSVDGEYYLDQLKTDSPDRILTFAQTGVTALSRAMVTKLNQVKNGAFFAAKIKDFLAPNDYVHISNEVSFADNCRGGSDTTVLCADWRMLNSITSINANIIELTGNHNNDYGAEANLATLKKYEELGLKTFGGGKDEEAARQPLRLENKDTKITLLGYNQSTSTKTNGQGATVNSPGANIYDAKTAEQDIKTAKENGDFVIVDVQYFECYSYPNEGTEMPACDAPISGQTDFFRHLIDLGADMVVGTQAHQPQTYELYKGKPIYYGLGNLFFDQTYWPGTTRSLVLTHYFLDGQYIQTRLSPTVYDANYQPRLMTEKESRDFLARLILSSPKARR